MIHESPFDRLDINFGDVSLRLGLFSVTNVLLYEAIWRAAGRDGSSSSSREIQSGIDGLADRMTSVLMRYNKGDRE